MSESSGRTGVRASNLAAALSQFCSAVRRTTRIRFEWSSKCGEPFELKVKPAHSGKTGTCTWMTLRCRGSSKVAKSDGKSREGPWTEKIDEGMRNANLFGCPGPGGSGRSSHDTSDNKEEKQRACGHGGLRITDGQVIALEWARSRCLSGLSYWKDIVSGAVKPKTKRISNREGRMCMTTEAPCLKPDTRNGSVRNFRGGAGNGI